MSLGTTDYQVFFAVSAGLAVVLAGYYVMHLLRARGRRLLKGESSPAKIDDRAFNQIRLARAEADALDRSGRDVARARQLIATAQARFDRFDYEGALGIAQSAHENLVGLRRGDPTSLFQSGPPASPVAVPPDTDSKPALAASPSGVPSGATPVWKLPNGGTSDVEASLAPRRAAIPKHRAESHFELSVLSDEVERAARSGTGGDPAIAEARGMAEQGQAAYERSEYTEALRLALRGRRRLAGPIEAIPQSVAERAAVSPASARIPGPRSESGGPAAEPTCPACGSELRSIDKFCRRCGAPRAAPRCARCGEELDVVDRFCGSCGGPVSSPA